MAVEIDANENSDKCRRGENIDRVPFYKLFSFADSIDISLMVVGTVGAVANGAIMPFTTALFGEIINAFGQLSANVVDAVSKVALKYAYLAVGSSIVAFLQVSCWIVTGERQASRIRALYLKAILRQDIAFFDMETNTGEVIGKMSGDSILIQDAIGEKVGKFVQLTSTFVGGFAVAFAKCWILTFVMIASIPMFLLVGAALTIIIDRMASRERVAYAKASTVVEQTISSIRTVASFTGEKQAIANYRKFLGSAYNVGVQEGLAIGLGLGSFMLVGFCCFSLAIWFGARMILEKGYSGGSVINVMIAVFLGAVSLGQATPCLSAFAAGQAAAYKMFETINRKPKIDAYETKGMVVKDIRGDVELRRVCFSYPARSDEKILQGFSLFIPNGTTAALVGQSGCGKSTVISLIERFYDPQAGKVLIDGVNIKKYQLKCIREKIALVSQEPALFTSSILDNIAYGKEGATIEEIRSAAKLANAAKFIDKLPEGLDTMVGERGIQISGGQKQRIAIARAILKDPRILLLDEATSALDSKAERKVQDALDRIMINRTTIMVAHRLSTVRNADMIAVIHHGKIVEKGTHQELVKDLNGAYSRLIQLQNMHKECNEVEDKHKRSDISSGSFKHSGQSMSPLHSIGWGSFSSHFSVSLGLPNRWNENALEEHKPIEEEAPEVSISRLAYLNKPETVVLIFGAIAASVIGTIFPVFGILLSKVIKTFFQPPKELREDSEFWARIFLIVGLVSLVMYPLQKYLFAIAGSKLIQRIRSICFERVVHMEIGWFDKPQCSSGKIGAKLSADAAAVRSLVGDALAQLVQNIASSVVGLIIAFTASWQLAFIILAVIPMLGISNYTQAMFLKGFSADSKMMYEQASQVAKDAVGSIRTVASFCAEKKVMDLYKNKCEGPMRRGMRQGMISGIGFGVSFFLLFSVYATSFYAGAQLVQHKKTTFTGVFQVFFALSMAAMGVTQSSSIAPDFSKAKRATASIFAIVDRKSTMDSSNKSGAKLKMLYGKIALRRVSFKYPSRPNVQIFRNLSLVIPSGKTVALVGENGSGKSTIFSLLLRFYDPDSGQITLDGVDIRELRLKWLRQQMGLVSQEPTLFNDTIRANIEYGKGGGNADEAEIIAASKLANAHKFISCLQQGYDTLVGDGGVQLSGGQKQRIAIARAIIKNPKILLLDEATSALDAESEKVVQDALDRVMVNHTTVIVAHRLSTIKNADVIAVVKDGVIVEKGTHASLINIRNGFYASLVSLYMSTSNA